MDDLEKDLLMKMLSKNPEFRWSANNLLKHKFFVSEDSIESEVDFYKLNNIAMYEIDKILVLRNRQCQLSQKIHLNNLVKIIVLSEIKHKLFL